jgi:hypothetical protein
MYFVYISCNYVAQIYDIGIHTCPMNRDGGSNISSYHNFRFFSAKLAENLVSA